jgi:antitoxin ParD1/3/4
MQERDMASMNVSLPDPMRDWVQGRIDSGSYASVSDYVRDLIRHDQAVSDQKQMLVNALIEGEQSGVSPLKLPDIQAEVLSEASRPGE